jgi:hypothetical protein
VAGAEIEEEGGGPAVIGKDCFEDGGRVGRAEGGVGEGVKSGFSGRWRGSVI